MARLINKTALITGGRQGIGRGIVDKFLAEGAQVMTCGRGPRPDDLPTNVLWVTADLSQRLAVDGLAQAIKREFGTLDVLVNNSGVQIEKTVLETTDDDWDTLMGINAKGMFMTCRALIPLMGSRTRENKSAGSIINIGSISGINADPGLAIYNASKAFVHGLTRSIAVDHGPQVRCNAIAPGWIMTGMADAAFALSNDPKAAEKDAVSRHAVGRFGQPADIANFALWLASDESAFATGQIYVMDGGLTAASPINTALF